MLKPQHLLERCELTPVLGPSTVGGIHPPRRRLTDAREALRVVHSAGPAPPRVHADKEAKQRRCVGRADCHPEPSRSRTPGLLALALGRLPAQAPASDPKRIRLDRFLQTLPGLARYPAL